MNEGFEDLGFAKVDTDRERRCGRPEIIFSQNKTPEEVAAIAEKLVEKRGFFLATRADRLHFEAVKNRVPSVVYHEKARCMVSGEIGGQPEGRIALVCAGTSDLPVAEEAAIVAEAFGRTVERFYDVGVAGLHRLLAQIEAIRQADVVIVVAGMEGALPSVVAGLVHRPVIAVPTSVGYGANFGGLTALLGMLNSCGSGVSVVNIDNGFGAAYAADSILRLVDQKTGPSPE